MTAIHDLTSQAWALKEQMKNLHDILKESDQNITLKDASLLLEVLRSLYYRERVFMKSMENDFKTTFIDRIEDDEELILAITEFSPNKRFDSDELDVTKYKGAISKVLDNPDLKPETLLSISSWKIEWNRYEIARLPISYLERLIKDYVFCGQVTEKESLNMRYCDEYDRPREIDCNPHELLFATIMMDRPDFTASKIRDLFLGWASSVDASMLPYPVRITRFRATIGEERDVLSQINDHYKSSMISPIVNKNRNLYLVHGGILISSVSDYNMELDITLGRGDTLRIEAPYMSYFFATHVSLSIETEEQESNWKEDVDARSKNYDHEFAGTATIGRYYSDTSGMQYRNESKEDEYLIPFASTTEKIIPVESSDACVFLSLTRPFEEEARGKALYRKNYLRVRSIRVYGEAISFI